MPEKRRFRRVKRRLRVNYGERDFSRSGLTGDVSEGGMFIVANSLEPLDTRLHLQVIIDPQNVAYLEAVVAWHKDIPPELRGSGEKRGFGVRFLTPSELMAAALRQPGVAEPANGPLLVRYDTPGVLQKAYMSELRMGGVYVHTPRALVRDTKLVVVIELGFAKKQFEFDASVLHVGDAGVSGVRGVALAFQNPDQVAKALAPFLS